MADIAYNSVAGTQSGPAVSPSMIGTARGSVPALWTRNGFDGDAAIRETAHELHSFLSVDGTYVPWRITLEDIHTPDILDPASLPTQFARAHNGTALAVSRVSERMPCSWRNVEHDELHFVQAGTSIYRTDFGLIEARPGDFLLIPRGVTYRLEEAEASAVRLIIESPSPFHLRPPNSFGMVNIGRDLRRPTNDDSPSFQAPPFTLLIKSADSITRYEMRNDPLALARLLMGDSPVWALNLRDIQPVTYVPNGGPPASVIETADRGLIVYPLSARPGRRPPEHVNADYDEITYYFDGPGAYGAVRTPGTMCVVPKGLAHWGPSEDVPEGYWAWMLESAAALRRTPGFEMGDIMDTETFSAFAPLTSQAT